MRKYINYRLLIHIAIWSLVIILPLLVSNAAHGYSIGFIPGPLFLIATVIHILLFYTQSLYIFPRFFNKRRWWLYIILSLLTIGACNMLKTIIVDHWFPETFPHHSQITTFIIASSVDVYFISLAYCRIQRRLQNERLQKEREAAFLATELRFLRSQISPHFLFNVLTNLVSLARKNSTQLEPSLIRLSDLMRYMLYDTQDKKVALQKEIEYLDSYIQLQKLRFGSDLLIEFTRPKETEAEQLTIEPMLLIPFVENAFKHHDSATLDSLIAIQLQVKGTSLTFKVRNTFDPLQQTIPDENSGIGLNNVKTRLEILYKNNYTLNIKHDDSFFYITLTLNLS